MRRGLELRFISIGSITTFRPPEQQRKGISGELFAVHGGHFYQVSKYAGAPEELPETLHWFKWEAYFTWITGVSLLAVVYYFNANMYLVDSSVRELSSGAAIGLSVISLIGGWVVYDLLCKSPLAKKPVVFTAVGFTLMTAVAYGLSQVFAARAAYIHVGAMMGTMMAANVFFVIIPNQRKMVDAMVAGEEPDTSLGDAGLICSFHNNYFTLPVLFIMISNHFPMTYGHAFNWAVLARDLVNWCRNSALVQFEIQRSSQCLDFASCNGCDFCFGFCDATYTSASFQRFGFCDL